MIALLKDTDDGILNRFVAGLLRSIGVASRDSTDTETEPVSNAGRITIECGIATVRHGDIAPEYEHHASLQPIAVAISAELRDGLFAEVRGSSFEILRTLDGSFVCDGDLPDACEEWAVGLARDGYAPRISWALELPIELVSDDWREE
ncbi:MAG: hypothetical protein AAFU85_33740 [Planctomycetota bacterium]